MSTLDSFGTSGETVWFQADRPAEPREVSRLVGLAYDAVTSSELWPELFRELHAATGARASTLVIRGLGQTRYVSLTRPEPGLTVLNPPEVFQTRSLSRGSFTIALLVLTGKKGSRMELVEDGNDLRFLRGRLAEQARAEDACLSTLEIFATGEDGGARRREDLALLRELLPHLHRALSLSFELHRRKHHEDLHRLVLQVMDTPVLVVDARGQVNFSNRAARKRLRGGRALRIEGGRLRARNPEVQCELERSLREAAASKPPPRGGLRLFRPRGSRATELLWLRPLEAGTVLVLLAAGNDPSPVPPSLLGQAFGLTSTEAQVASLLTSTATVEEMARFLGSRPQTVRLHLKHLLAKTGTHRQVECLRRLLACTPEAHRHG